MLELRVGKVLEAQEIKGSDKLLKLIVDIGEKRQLVAGVRKWYSPEELVGKKIIVVANLKHAKIFGVESQGMLLAAEKSGDLALLTPDEDIKEGTPVVFEG